MRFKQILLEAPEDDVAPSVVSRKPSEVTADNLPDETKQLIEQGKWTEAYRTLVNTDDIKVFIDLFLKNCDLLASFQTQLEPIHDVLVRTMMSLGDRAFNPETNPILVFLNTFFGTNKKFDTGDQFKSLVNWWSEGIVTDKNLRETKIEKSILLNKNIYLKQNNTFIVQAYMWLVKKENIEAYVKVKDLQLRKNGEEITQDIHRIILNTPQPRNKSTGAFMEKQPYEGIRNYIIFYVQGSNEAADPAGEIAEASVIQTRLIKLQHWQEDIDDVKQAKIASGEINPDDEDNKKSKSSTPGIKPVRWSAGEVDAILNAGRNKLTKDTANVLMNYFKDRGFIG